ncbi:kynurenine formamidase-like [Hydra vulgaris]|uniref:Kynurenine formamidase-like n=1 Tax=Hydra vulgaris TaxID=6087 RepID=A0ABM4BW94_HYDVU
MDNTYFEKQYTPSYWTSKHSSRDACLEHYLKLSLHESEVVRSKFQCELNVPYGDSDRERVDFFFPEKVSDNKILFVYIHGGFWYEGNKEMYSMIAKPFLQNGHPVAVVGYDLCPTVSIFEIKKQVLKAFDTIKSRFPEFKLCIIGHSAGAYLAFAFARESKMYIKSLVLISGVYDVTHLIKTKMNELLQIDDKSADTLSLYQCCDKLQTESILFFFGTKESEEFQRQTQEFCEHVSKFNLNVHVCAFENEDHFSLVENFSENQSKVVDRIYLTLKV